MDLSYIKGISHSCVFNLMIPVCYCDTRDNFVRFEKPKSTGAKGEFLFCVRSVTFLPKCFKFCPKSWTFEQILTVKRRFCFQEKMKSALWNELCWSEKRGGLFRKRLISGQFSFFTKKCIFVSRAAAASKTPRNF